MTIRIITDSSAGIPPHIAEELEITVLDLHVTREESEDADSKKGETQGTSGLSALELAAAYARQLERCHDEGIVVLHLSKRLSSTWSAAVSASAVFDDTVRVIDTSAVGMSLGFAAIVAASFARSGADLGGCVNAAKGALALSETWLYLSQLDDIRKSGRISATTAVLSAALLATKPILRVHDGKLELAIKTRTQKKAFSKLVEHVVKRADGMPGYAAVQYAGDREGADVLKGMLEEALPEGSTVGVYPLDEVLTVHTGEGALGLSVFFATPTVD